MNTILTGVISINNVNYEEIENEICLDCAEIEYQIKQRLSEEETKNQCQNPYYDEELKEELEDIECFDHTKLIGSWKKGTTPDGEPLYIPDMEGEYSAIVTSATFNCIQVVWSKKTSKNKRFCSPCFPNQADLDSENGNLEAYCLPDYLVRKNE